MTTRTLPLIRIDRGATLKLPAVRSDRPHARKARLRLTREPRPGRPGTAARELAAAAGLVALYGLIGSVAGLICLAWQIRHGQLCHTRHAAA